MFLSGRRKTAVMRATAGMGVALMLVSLYRPARAAVAETKESPTVPPGTSQARSAPTPPATTAVAPTAAAERVRTAVTPVGVKLDNGAMGADPWALFDGDRNVPFQTGQPVRVRVSLPKGVGLEAIGVFGGAAAVITASADGAAGAKAIAGLERIALEGLPARWNRFSASAPVETSTLLVDITPAPGQRAQIPELEIWGRAAASDRPSSSAAWAEALLTHLPPGVVQVSASPASSSPISGPQLGPKGHIPFTFDLDRAGASFERAFIVYELEGLAHWSSVVRRVNWQPAQGGFHAVRTARGGLQVEEISPVWLKYGRNELQFVVSNDDLAGYKVKNLRVVGVPPTANGVARAQVDTPRADKAAAALVDGNRETGLTNKDIRRPQAIDFTFTETSQPDSLLVAVDKGTKATVVVQPIINGKLSRSRQVSAELEKPAAGWVRIPLDDLAVEADGVRVTVRGAGGESIGGQVSELRVTGSRLPNRRVAGMVVTYPLHRECVDGEAYVRGFLRGDATGSIKGATLRIAGSARPDALAADGAFAAVVPAPKPALRSGGKWQIELEAGFANGDRTGAVVDVEGCKEPVIASHAGPVEDQGAPFGQLVRAGEGAKLAFAGATLQIPAGALDHDTRITIRPISDIDIPATDESLTNVTAGGRAYRLGPHGLKFAKAVSLTIPFDRRRFVGGQAEDDLGAYYFDDQAKRWRQVQTLRGDASGQLLTAATEHFTDFIAGTISTPDHPAGDSFNPNSIKDMKAADPAAGIDLIQPPEANPDGAAHLSFPLWVPPGRQGMQPALTVTYSSEAGDGLLGMGWDLPISSIAVDTRFGSPRYDLTSESETYGIDGELLVMDPGQMPRARRTTFHRRTEGKFDAIYRIAQNVAGPIEELPIPGGGDNAYHWEVLDKRGTRYIYGETFSARGSFERRGVFRWYLSRVIDAFGNQVLYTYDKTFPTLHPATGTVPTVSVLLKNIQYTADRTGANPHYRIDFLYDGDPNANDNASRQQRPDVMTNARGGSIEVTARRLAHILVYEAGNTGSNNIRRYDFPYVIGNFGKSLLNAIVVAQGPMPGDVDNQNGNEFYRHTFNYLSLNQNAFEAPVPWTGATSDTGLSNMQSDSVSGSITGGWGPGGCVLFHGVVGGSVSTDIPLPLPDFIPHTNEDRAQQALVDVNGDGLPDVLTTGGALVNAGAATRSFGGLPGFGLPGDSPFPNHTTRFSAGFNVGIHALYEAVHAGAGMNWSWIGDDKTLADIDGDGFLDYLTSGQFYLNHGKGFTDAKGWGALPPSAVMDADAIQQQKNNFALVDPVIQWTAPTSGHVRLINGAAQKAPNAHGSSDGVMIFMESYSTQPIQGQPNRVVRTSTWSQKLTDSSFCTPAALPATTGCNNGNREFFVKRGDRVYFRVDAIDDIEDDVVTWNPVLSYIDVTDDFGGNAQTVTGAMRALPEAYTGAAFDYVQSADFRLAGKPTPMWRSDSMGTGTVRVTITGNITKHETTDAAVFEVLKLAVDAPPNTPPTQIPISGLNSVSLGATFDNTFAVTQTFADVKTGDRLFFRVSSATPIDENQIQWAPRVEYQRFCRIDQVAAGSQNFNNATTFCGRPINCSSGAGGQCQLEGDPRPDQNPQSPSVIIQDIAPYFELKDWTSGAIPAAFVPLVDGTIRLTGTNSGMAGRAKIRSVNHLLFDAPLPGGIVAQVPPTEQILDVKRGVAILFDAFYTTTPGSNDNWRANFVFNGNDGTTSNNSIVARRNVLASNDGGHHHGWSTFEWTNDGVHPFDDASVQKGLAEGFGDTINQNPGNTNGKTPVRLMRESPQGLVRPNQPTVAGPLWVGASVDGYVGQGFFKPSRIGRPVTGSAVSFSHTRTKTTDSGVSALFGIAHDDSEAHTDQMLIDMNGDRFPDLVTGDSIRYNRVAGSGTTNVSGFFDAAASPIRDADNQPTSLGDLRNVTGHSVNASLGISAPVAAYRKSEGEKETPGWVSTLPSMGIGYGHQMTNAELMDFNGDGLPDYIARDGAGKMTVRLNLGYSFAAPMDVGVHTWGQGPAPPVPTITGQNFSAPVLGDFQGEVADSLNGSARSDALRLEHTAANNIGTGYSYFGGNATASVTRTTSDMIDINGDGLPDMVTRPPGAPLMQVKYNTGDGFTAEQFWSMPDWGLGSQDVIQQIETIGFGNSDALSFSESKGLSFSVGYSTYWETGFAGCFDFEAGAGAGRTFGGSEMKFEDIDGDGAPDQVLKIKDDDDTRILVRRNGTTTRAGLKPNLLQQVINPLGGGFQMTYRPMGNVVETTKRLDMPNVVDMPSLQFALFFVQAFSTLPTNPIQDPRQETIIDYGVTPSTDPFLSQGIPSGTYDRVNREFLGFARVTITHPGERKKIERAYDTSTYERRHLLLDEKVRDAPVGGTATLFKRTKSTYESRPVVMPGTTTVIPGVVFPALTTEQTFFYEGLTNEENAPIKSTKVTHDYDQTGNPSRYVDFGDDNAAVTSDDVFYSIGYQSITDTATGTTFPRPNSVVACNVPQPVCPSGNVLRQRNATYGTRGEMLSLEDVLFGGKNPTTGQPYLIGQTQNPTWGFTYDDFGNLATSTDPSGYLAAYTYDTTAQTHIASITDNFGLSSSRKYDMRFGRLSDTADVNGQREHSRFDLFGRPDQFCGPGDVVAGSTQGTFACSAAPTMTFSYAIAHDFSTSGSANDGVAPFYALTTHKDVGRLTNRTNPNNPANDTLDTVVIADGFGRARQMKTDAFVGNSEGRVLTGRVTFDRLGRPYQEGYPTFETASNSQQKRFVPWPNVPYGKTNAYDVLDRLRAVQTPDDRGTTVAPDGAKVITTLIDYNAKVLPNSGTQLAKTVQDPLGKLRTAYVSPRGELIAMSEMNRLAGAITPTVLTTRYFYDPLSQLTQVQDPNANLTTAQYDSLGHMVKLVSADTGQTEWRYDTAGRLAARETANLRAKGQLIKYTYDVNRVKTIDYPTTPDVTYTYGAAGEAGPTNGNVGGRIRRIEDESGVETRKYDELGNISHMEKTPMPLSPSIPGVTYKMDYKYDLFGRVLDMTYPDGGTVTYGYDSGGSVNSVKGLRKGVTTNYVTNILYNQMGQRIDLTLGNGWNTHYFYYTDTKRLQSIITKRGTSKIQDIGYGYDLVGNITGFSNNLPTLPPVAPNTVIAPGPTFQTFGYDDLYQLTSAFGRYTGCACGCGNERVFSFSMQYDGLGNITRKTQNDAINKPSGTSTTQVATSYNVGYTYDSRPHAPTGVGETTLTYDADGNQTVYSGSFGPSRSLTWTEEDRLRTETDSGFTNTFLYDAAGNRSHKRRTTLETWYVNPFYVVKNSLTETKHIMLGDERLVTDLATMTNRADPSTAGTSTLFYYHPDHIQSTSYVTGGDGSILQHDEYFPSGELWFQEQKNNDARNTQPYLFSAKELDETGLYYFGARYYNPKFSIWTSPDPILASYMRSPASASPKNLGLYSYGWNNPIVMRDPDGRQARRGARGGRGAKGGEEALIMYRYPELIERPERNERTREREENLRYNTGPGQNAPTSTVSPNQPAGAQQPIVVGEVTTYREFKRRSVRGDKIDGHDPWQIAWRRAHGQSATRGGDTMVVALPEEVHDQITELQREAGMHKESVLAKQSALENISRNVDFMRQVKVDPSTIRDVQFATTLEAIMNGNLTPWDAEAYLRAQPESAPFMRPATPQPPPASLRAGWGDW